MHIFKKSYLMNKKKLIFFSSTLFNINLFLLDLIDKLKNEYEIYIICASDNNNKRILGVNYIQINFDRKIRIFKDIKFFFSFSYFLLKIKPNIIFTITPKISFIVSLVNIFHNCKRIHFFTGQIWYNKYGLKRLILKNFDLFIQNRSRLCFVDSNSQLKFLIQNGFNKDKIKLILNGSINGVDTEKFIPNINYKKNFKKKYNIENGTLILLFLGRITKDKGIYDLLSLYEKLLSDNLKIKLVIAGSDEEHIISKISSINKKLYNSLIYLGQIDITYQIIPIADVFILLSKREGFGLSIIEASSCSIPIIANNIVGLRDSVSNNNTGILIDNFKNFHDYNNIKKLMSDPNLREKLGKNGRSYVQKYFQKKDVINYLYNELKNIL